MDFDAVCRTCLGTETLNPIFKNKDHHNRFSTALLDTTGLKVELNDGLPQKICIACMSHIYKCLKFRAQCQDSQTKLLQILNGCDNVKYYVQKLDEVTVETREKKVINYSSEEAGVKTLTDLKNSILTNRSHHDLNCVEINERTLNGMELVENNDMEDSFVNFVENNDMSHDENNELVIDTSNAKGDCINTFENNLIKECNTETQNNDKNLDNIETDTDSNEYVKSELDIEMDRVTCKLCGKSLSICSVDGHMRKMHPGLDKKLKCEICNIDVSRRKLKRHFDVFHKGTKCKSKELGECEICHKKMQKVSLKMHHKVTHAGLGPVCDHCGRKCGNKFRLEEHLRAKHGYDKYKCGECEFQSASGMAMKNHERRHRGEKPYVCEVCGAAFHAAYLLSQHKQSHRKEKMLKCDICPASFKANNSLHMHKMTCHSRTSYKCTHCPRVFTCRHYVVKHLRNVHKYTGTVGALEHK